MWQLFALGSLLATAGQDVVDKFAMVESRLIRTSVASFYRTLFFLLATIAIGLTGVLGPLRFIVTPSLLLFTPLCIGSSLFWTYLLRKVEVTNLGALDYLPPFIFLFIDTTVVHAHISLVQAAGIALLACGGLSFTIDGKTRHLKPELTRWVWLGFIFNVSYTGAEAYLFRHLNATTGLDGTSFFASLWLLATVGLLLLVLLRAEARWLWNAPVRRYLPRIAVSKAFDSASSVLWAQALTFAAVSQVSAFGAAFPAVLLLVAIAGQKLFGLRLEEKLTRAHMTWKTGGVLLLVIGGLLVS